MAFVDLAGRRERTLLDRIEAYYDMVPRSCCRAEDFGALTLFVREGEGWPFYARPARGWTGPVGVADVDRVRARQRELGIPESFEWVAETSPGLRAAVAESGLVVHEHPLMVLGSDTPVPGAPTLAGGLSVRIVGSDDRALPSALAVAHLAFAEPGTRVGVAGAAELAKAVREAGDGAVERMAGRIRTGLTVVAAVTGADGVTALCSGQHQPVGTVSEIVAVATLPAARRQGLCFAVTAALVTGARATGVETVFLAAADDVVRIYARLGFRHIATALIADPAK